MIVFFTLLSLVKANIQLQVHNQGNDFYLPTVTTVRSTGVRLLPAIREFVSLSRLL